MKRLAISLVLLSASVACATNGHYQNYCQNGGQQVSVQGLTSSNYVQQSYPQCTVTVYQTGGTTLARLFYLNGSAKPNPFTASVSGYYDFYVDVTVSVDITQSGGGLTAPVTLSNINVGGGSGGGGVTSLPFSAVTSGVSAGVALQVGDGSSLSATGSGTIDTNSFHGNSVVQPSFGGTGLTAGSIAADRFLQGQNGGTWDVVTVPNCDDTGGQHLNYDNTSHSFSCGTASNVSAVPFSSLTAATVANNALVVGSGASLSTTSNGTINANRYNGNQTVAAADGGTGLTTGSISADSVLQGQGGGTWNTVSVPSCSDVLGQHLNYSSSTHVFSCGTSGTGAGLTTPITSASESSTTATINLTTNLGQLVGDRLVVIGVTPAGYNGTFTITAATTTSASYTTTGGLGVGTVFGTATLIPATSGGGAFSGLTGGTNTSAAMTVGSGSTFGWSGSGTIDASSFRGNTTIPASAGGTGVTTPTTDDVLVGVSSAWTQVAIPVCLDSAGNHLNYNTGTHAFSCGTTGAAFGSIGTGTNSSSTLTVGTGGSLTFSGSGTVNASKFNGNGRVAVADGGTNLTTSDIAANTTLVGTGSGVLAGTSLPTCGDTGGNHLNFDTTSHTFSCGTSGGSGGGGDATSIQGKAVVFTSLATGDLIHYNGTNFVNFSPLWCPLTGCTMTGAITLSADPTTSLNPVTLNYFNTHTANFVTLNGSGFVTPSQLGSGTANSTTALFGNNTWAAVAGTGACTNKVVTSVNSGGVPTCTTVGTAMVDEGQILTKDQANIASGYIATDTTNSAIIGANFTVGGQLMVTGPFLMTSSLPGSSPAAPSVGTAQWGFDTDGYLQEWPGAGGGAATKVRIATRSGSTTTGHSALFDSVGNIVDGGAAGAGNVSAAGMTTNQLPKASGVTTLVDSSLSDNGTIVTNSESLAFSGATPAITTTTANADLIIAPNGSGGIQIPNGTLCTNPSMYFAANVLTGMFDASANIGGFCANGAQAMGYGTTGLLIVGTKDLAFTSGSNLTATQDTFMSRAAAGVIAIGTTSAPTDDTGLLRSANTQGISGGNLLVTNTTAATLATWTLPAVAKTWTYNCRGAYSTSATTDHLVIIINAAKSPTYEMGTAQIYTDNGGTNTTGTQVFGTPADATDETILTGAAENATVTNYNFSVYGSVEASATSGAFTIKVNGSNTGTLTIVRGAFCTLNF